MLVAIGAIVALVMVSQQPPKKAVLFSNLSDDDAARIVEKLKASNIPYEFGPDATTLLVPEKQVHETRLMLATEGLPSGGGVGFEVFDQQRFGESEFSEQVKYHRALEGELSRTISHLAGVKRARVHLVLPTRSLFAEDAQGASASVVVHLVPGWKMREDQVKGIVHLVASSVRGLDAEHVTLVDGDGRTLGRGTQDQGELANAADGYRRDVERSKERSAQQMLDTTLGQGKSMVRVAAAVSFTREEVTEETYDPKTIAQRSMQVTEERDGTGDRTLGGLPGTPSNLPGGEAPGIGGNVGGGGLARRSETRNYEVSKVLRHAVEPVGRVTGLQVAVVVDGRYTGTGDKRKFAALSADELGRIQHLVAGAIGIDEKRGDRVIVECIAFAQLPVPPDDRSLVERTLGPYGLYMLIAAVVILVVIALLWLARRGRKVGPGLPPPTLADVLQHRALPGLGDVPGVADPAALPAATSATAIGAGLPGLGPDAVAAGAAGVPGAAQAAAAAPGGAAAVPPTAALPFPPIEREPQPDAEAIEQVRQLASDMATKEPEAAARVLRGWLNEGRGTPSP